MQELFLFHSTAWNQCVNSFLERKYRRTGSQDTLTSYRFVLCQFFSTPTKLPSQYTTQDIENYLWRPVDLHRNRGGEPGEATRNWRLTALKSFYKFASSFYPDGSRMPLLQCPPPTAGIDYAKVPRQPRALSEQELERFFAAIPETVVGLRDRAIFLLYFFTGRRRSEIARLKWGDIEATSTVPSGHLYRYVGKGKGHQSKARELPKLAYLALLRYLEASGRKKTIKKDDALFIASVPTRLGAPSGERGLSLNAIDYALKKYAKAAGLDPKRVHLHRFRHTAALQRWQIKPDLLAIMRFLDHESPGPTLVYLELLTGIADEEAPQLEEKFAHLSR